MKNFTTKYISIHHGFVPNRIISIKQWLAVTKDAEQRLNILSKKTYINKELQAFSELLIRDCESILKNLKP